MGWLKIITEWNPLQVATECRNIPALEWLLHEHAGNLFQPAASTPPVFEIA